MSQNVSETESTRQFMGERILGEYVDAGYFIKLLYIYGYDATESNSSIVDLYNLVPTEIYNQAFFECVFYNHLKNIFVYDIKVDKEKFKEEIVTIVKDINDSTSIPSALKPLIKSEGFNFLPLLGSHSKLGDKFVIALDYKENQEEQIDIARIIFTQVAPTKIEGKIAHSVCGVTIDFINKKCTIAIKNNTDLSKGTDVDLIEKLTITLSSYREWVISKLSLLVDFKNHDVENIRMQMSNLCKGLDEKLLLEDRSFISEKLKPKVEENITEYFVSLTSDRARVSNDERESLINTTLSLLNGIYVKQKYQGNELQKKAKQLGLEGYPTKIQYTSSKLDRGATQSSSVNDPIASSDIYHSLYSNFVDANSLEKWSIAWFTDLNKEDESDLDVIQTTIYVRLGYVHIIFLPKRPLNEEIINYVIRKIGY